MLNCLPFMNRIFKFLLIAFVMTLFLNLGPEVYAACNNDEIETDIGCLSKTDPGKATSQIYTYGLGLIGGVALLSILYGGYIILTSQGDPSQLQKGKSYIVYAIAGLVLAIGGYTFYRVIAADVLQIPGFK